LALIPIEFNELPAESIEDLVCGDVEGQLVSQIDEEGVRVKSRRAEMQGYC
jgi:hypothetical protein